MSNDSKVLRFAAKRPTALRREADEPTYRLKPEVRTLLKHYAAGRIPEKYLRVQDEDAE